MTNSSDNLQPKVQIDLSLIAELQRLGIKHNPEKIIRIVKLSDGKIIFLEEGKEGRGGSGLKHILQEHRLDFSKRGIIEEQIPDLIINAIINGQVIGYQKTRSLTPRVIYEVSFNNQLHYIAITIGDNGYIVGANPAEKP